MDIIAHVKFSAVILGVAGYRYNFKVNKMIHPIVRNVLDQGGFILWGAQITKYNIMTDPRINLIVRFILELSILALTDVLSFHQSFKTTLKVCEAVHSLLDRMKESKTS